jgi:lipoprotein-anchoring transpeptidase ErfK/SrfK
MEEIKNTGQLSDQPENNPPAQQEDKELSETSLKKTSRTCSRRKIRFLLITGSIFLVTCLMVIFVINIPFFQESGGRFIDSSHYNNHDNDSLPAFRKAISEKEKNIAELQKKLDKLTPTTKYLVVNTTENIFSLFSGKELIREGKCSTGSYTMLVSGDNKKWIFKTPKGIFKIKDKKTSPVWKKPDWAFVEEGLPVPPPNHDSRFEYGTLGDYALSLGDGYLIHGTLYQRFLGLPVTHGCIRLGDDDLEKVYRSLEVGSKVYIF